MDIKYLSEDVHNEFAKHIQTECNRLRDEDNRQNDRIKALENTVHEINVISTNVEKLAVNMAAMLKAQEEQNTRLKALENRDGDKWRKMAWYVLTALVGAGVAFILARLGLK